MPLPADAADRALSRLAKLQSSSSGEYTQDVANDIRKNDAAAWRACSATQKLMDFQKASSASWKWRSARTIST
ncbi:hypothetical protein ACTMU2_27975 [Cupriavidus basilensis]